MNPIKKYASALAAVALISSMNSCKPKNVGSAVSGDAASKTYVAPGKYDEFYNFVSGGFIFHGLIADKCTDLPVQYARGLR